MRWSVCCLSTQGKCRIESPGWHGCASVQVWTTMAADMITVLLVDDDGRFRRIARRMLTEDGLKVVAEAADGRTALEAVSEWTPDVVLLDIGLPDIDGREVARRLREGGSGATVVLISSRDADYGQRVADGVAAGFIPKDELSRERIQAIAGPSPR